MVASPGLGKSRYPPRNERTMSTNQGAKNNVMTETAKPEHELARRMLAALMSYQLSIGMDYCLKNYIPKDVDSDWEVLASGLLRVLLSIFPRPTSLPKEPLIHKHQAEFIGTYLRRALPERSFFLLIQEGNTVGQSFSTIPHSDLPTVLRDAAEDIEENPADSDHKGTLVQ